MTAKNKIEEVVDKLDRKPQFTNKRFMYDWDPEWNFRIAKDYYDGPYWSIWVGPIAILFWWHGLPHIFQKEINGLDA